MADLVFHYRAVGSDGKPRRGQISARDEAEAFARLRAEQMSPLDIRRQAGKTKSLWTTLKADGVKPADLEALLTNLSVLLRAGADIRTALLVLDDEDAKGARPLKAVATKILSGSSLESALTPVFPEGQAHLGALIAAGEARGDLPSGLEAAGRVLAARRVIRQQLIEALSYPAFVFITAIAALLVILLVVVPAIAPLLDEAGQSPPIYFQIIVGLSQGLQWGWGYMLMGLAVLAVTLVLSWRFGRLKDALDLWWLDGPLSGIVRGLTFGGFARALGDTLAGGAGLTESLRLSLRGVGSSEARKRLDIVVHAVRQGQRLSEGLSNVKGFPRSIIKLTEVGEASGQLGPMLSRAGQRSETDALHRIEKLSKILGPALILGLGLMIGALMGGVLAALTDIGTVTGG